MTGAPGNARGRVKQRPPRLQSEIGARMRARREELQLGQRELAKIAGVDASLVWKYESGRVLQRIDLLEPLALALDVTLDWLVTGRAPRTPYPVVVPTGTGNS